MRVRVQPRSTPRSPPTESLALSLSPSLFLFLFFSSLFPFFPYLFLSPLPFLLILTPLLLCPARARALVGRGAAVGGTRRAEQGKERNETAIDSEI